jgi:hypothetical protein
MKHFALIFAMFFCTLPVFAAKHVVLQNRAFSATGTPGCTVSGATVATPSVITCSANHLLVSGDQVQITGIIGTSTDNTLAYVNVLSATTFGIYSDPGLTTGITGTGTYSSGGSVSMAYDISGCTGDFTVTVRIVGLTAAKKVQIIIQDSTDGFASDIRTQFVVDALGEVDPGSPVNSSVRSYQIPNARFGHVGATLRLYVQSLDAGGSTTCDLIVE